MLKKNSVAAINKTAAEVVEKQDVAPSAKATKAVPKTSVTRTSPKAVTNAVPKPASKPLKKPVVNVLAKKAVAASPRSLAKPTGKSMTEGMSTRPSNVASKSPSMVTNGANSHKGIDGEVEQHAKLRKPKLVRDRFTMPESEYAALGEIKKACLKAGYEVKKSELLRVGVALVRKMDIVALKDILAALPPLKPGRPKNQ